MSSARNELMHESTVSAEEQQSAAMPGPSGTCATIRDGRCCTGLAVAKEGKQFYSAVNVTKHGLLLM